MTTTVRVAVTAMDTDRTAELLAARNEDDHDVRCRVMAQSPRVGVGGLQSLSLTAF